MTSYTFLALYSLTSQSISSCQKCSIKFLLHVQLVCRYIHFNYIQPQLMSAWFSLVQLGSAWFSLVQLGSARLSIPKNLNPSHPNNQGAPVYLCCNFFWWQTVKMKCSIYLFLTHLKENCCCVCCCKMIFATV